MNSPLKKGSYNRGSRIVGYSEVGPKRAWRRSTGDLREADVWPALLALAKESEDLLAFKWRIRQLFCFELPASGELRNVDVLKPQRQRLAVQKPWIRLKLVVQMWPE